MISRINYNNPNSGGELSLPYHYEMVADEKRVVPFKRAISLVCKDKIVLESGTGSGILSILAAQAGAKEVYTVEIDPVVAELAKKNIQGSGFRNITLIQKSILDVGLEDIHYHKADVVIAENLSTWQVTEPQVKIMNYVNEYLAKETAIHVPACISNCVELAESKYLFENMVEMKTHYFEFSGIRQPKILSDKILFQRIDLNRKNATLIDRTVEIDVTEDGVLNSLRLTSPLEIYGKIRFGSSDSLMPPVIVPLENALHVRKGERVRLKIHYEMNTRWESFQCSAIKTDCRLHKAAKTEPKVIFSSTVPAPARDPAKPIFSWFQNTPLGKEIFLTLYTKKCSWSRCTFCTLPTASSPTQVGPDHILAQARLIFDSLKKEELNKVRRLFISNNGSVLDQDTMPADVLDHICELAYLHCPSLEVICFETRYEWIKKSTLEHFIDNFKFWHDLYRELGIRKEKNPVKIQISCGYETQDPYIRNNILNKGYPEEIVRQSFKICSDVKLNSGSSVLFDKYVLLKPAPEMTNEEAVEESVQTIAHLTGLGQCFNVPVSIRLNPTFVAKNSHLHKQFKENNYIPPTLEDVVKVLRICHAKNLKSPIFVGLNDEGLGIPSGSFKRRSKTDVLYYKALQEFNFCQDYGVLPYVHQKDVRI